MYFNRSSDMGFRNESRPTCRLFAFESTLPNNSIFSDHSLNCLWWIPASAQALRLLIPSSTIARTLFAISRFSENLRRFLLRFKPAVLGYSSWRDLLAVPSIFVGVVEPDGDACVAMESCMELFNLGEGVVCSKEKYGSHSVKRISFFFRRKFLLCFYYFWLSV